MLNDLLDEPYWNELESRINRIQPDSLFLKVPMMESNNHMHLALYLTQMVLYMAIDSTFTINVPTESVSKDEVIKKCTEHIPQFKEAIINSIEQILEERHLDRSVIIEIINHQKRNPNVEEILKSYLGYYL